MQFFTDSKYSTCLGNVVFLTSLRTLRKTTSDGNFLTLWWSSTTSSCSRSNHLQPFLFRWRDFLEDDSVLTNGKQFPPTQQSASYGSFDRNRGTLHTYSDSRKSALHWVYRIQCQSRNGKSNGHLLGSTQENEHEFREKVLWLEWALLKCPWRTLIPGFPTGLI